ncbi:hypothetical protein ACODT3_19890 [Streptomyces sp. 4.24]|uniref:hypothetical protein n=1 Tax=Streptomyces tritrimontium TaxID=3406573 RepID=UPI003BB4D589
MERVRTMPQEAAHDGLVLALLQGALRDAAPEWLVQTAIEGDLERSAKPYEGPCVDLLSAALSHPSCMHDRRVEALRRCSGSQLAALGRAGNGELLAHGVASELRDRRAHSRPMTPEQLAEPGDAQLVLRNSALHDVVFAAALELLPTLPRPAKRGDGEDFDAWYDAHTAALDAWRAMWEQVVSTHTHRHRQLVEWAAESPADGTIRRHLLSTLPWEVEPSLLEEIANDDLARFGDSLVITRLCRMFRDGASEQEVRSHFSDEIEHLTPKRRRHIEDYISDAVGIREYGEHAATSWMESSAEDGWRYILNPTDAKHRYGEPHAWRSPDDLLRTLGERFARAGVEALMLWEPQEDAVLPSPRNLRWVHSTLVHLPIVSGDVEERVRAMLKASRPDPRARLRAHDYAALDNERKLSELRTAIERIIGDPAAAARKAALGDPQSVTVRDLAGASEEVLEDYLERHAGNGDLVEKTLLAFASRSYRSKPTFADVLARHPTPQSALLGVTTDLRRRLGGSPNHREAWTREVLALPDNSPELIRALPAWTVLTIGGSSRYGAGHNAVTAAVMHSLGDSKEAWARFASNPASYSGPTAWLRLGDILDASVNGTPWPTPPTAR